MHGFINMALTAREGETPSLPHVFPNDGSAAILYVLHV